MICNSKNIKIILTLLLVCSILTGCCHNNSSSDSDASSNILPSPSIVPATFEPEPTPTPAPSPIPLRDISLAVSDMDYEMFGSPNMQGSIETVEYSTVDYTSSLSPITKNMCIYLPYGYNSNQKYDVVFLMHTKSASETFWFSVHDYCFEDGHTEGLYIPYMIDNMIELGYCKPLIVVSLCGYMNDDARWAGNSSRDFEQFSYEFRNDILPYIESHYSVNTGRDHVAFIGASFGAYLNYRSIMGDCYDIVSYFGVTGGGTLEPEWLFPQWNEFDADMKVNCIYIGEGDMDDRGPVELGYMYLSANTDRFDSSNLYFTLFENTGHEFREWDNTLYNCLQLFFR